MWGTGRIQHAEQTVSASHGPPNPVSACLCSHPDPGLRNHQHTCLSLPVDCELLTGRIHARLIPGPSGPSESPGPWQVPRSGNVRTALARLRTRRPQGSAHCHCLPWARRPQLWCVTAKPQAGDATQAQGRTQQGSGHWTHEQLLEIFK